MEDKKLDLTQIAEQMGAETFQYTSSRVHDGSYAKEGHQWLIIHRKQGLKTVGKVGLLIPKECNDEQKQILVKKFVEALKAERDAKNS